MMQQTLMKLLSMKLLKTGNGTKGAYSGFELCLNNFNNLFIGSKHPYIFFNQDHTTLTFIGFNVNDKLQCTDPKYPDEIIKGCTIPQSVYECLLTQGLNLKEEDCNSWNKYDKLFL